MCYFQRGLASRVFRRGSINMVYSVCKLKAQLFLADFINSPSRHQVMGYIEMVKDARYNKIDQFLDRFYAGIKSRACRHDHDPEPGQPQHVFQVDC